MIAGEMVRSGREMSYDGFGLSNQYLGFNGQKKKEKTPAQKAQEKADRQKKVKAFVDKTKNVADTIQSGLNKAGGVEGIAKTYSNVKKYLKDDSPTAPDYDVDLGQKPAEEEKKKGIPTVIWVVGGISLLVTAGLLIHHFAKVRSGRAVSSGSIGISEVH